ncbi:MAG: TonB-dependent receptor, partial [Bdellovibrionales bacterium]|nr:TonB-dependent receptor [Bdellovibrionales bacterium]
MMSKTVLAFCFAVLLFSASAAAEEQLFVTPSPSSYKDSFYKPQQVITSAEIERSSARTLDDILRTVPGFSLFRRSSSEVANPTSQGANLRGIGPSAASRVLVLLDDQPLGDPFGGWINWGKVPLEDIERIEIYRGGGGQHRGNFALGGLIKIVSKKLRQQRGSASAEIGSKETEHLNFSAAESSLNSGVGAAARYFDTAGYDVIAPEDRGLIDQPASSRTGVLRLRAEHRSTDDLLLGLDAAIFNEDRNNGTPLTSNATTSARFALRVEQDINQTAHWQLLLYSEFQTYQSTFSSQAEDRDSEVPVLDQFNVPSKTFKVDFDWQQSIDTDTVLQAGAALEETQGETNENFLYAGGNPTRTRAAGGVERILSTFAAVDEQVNPQTSVYAVLRFDLVNLDDGFSRSFELSGNQALAEDLFASRTYGILSPRLRGTFELAPGVSFNSSLYQTFRAPTLNELYRPFRVRSDITAANAALKPEKLLGVDGGVDFSRYGIQLNIASYANWIRDLIANTTISDAAAVSASCGFVPDGGVCRERNNLAEAFVYGAETNLSYSWNSYWMAQLNYAYRATEITSSKLDPQLEGKQLAQVPKHAATAKASYDNPTLLRAEIELRYVGEQFEDDLNQS